MAWGEPNRADTVLKLGHRLVADGKAYALAEIAVVKQTALALVGAARTGVVLGIVALLLVLSALPVLIAALGMTLAIWIGAAAGLFAAAMLAIVFAALLAVIAARKLGAIGKAIE